MAKLSTKLPDDLLMQLSKLGEHTDEITEKMLKAGGEAAKAEMKNALENVIGKGNKTDRKSSGQLLKSLGVTPARQDRNGNFDVKVGFAENRTDGAKNALIAAVLEYGRSDREPKPFLKKAKRKSSKKCAEEMSRVFEYEVKKYVDT